MRKRKGKKEGVSSLFEDRENDWLACQIREENRLKRSSIFYAESMDNAKGRKGKKDVSAAERLKKLHEADCDAKNIKEEHHNNCDAQQVKM